MIIDMTTPNNAVMSLGEFLNIYPEDILEYVAMNKDSTVDDFIEHFNINLGELLSKELYLSCLHVTTNNNECETIKKYGLTNLQDSIKLDTPLGKYLREKGIDVDIENKKVSYKEKVFDISSEKNKFGIHQENLDRIHYKFFKDYQINAFFSYDNVLKYGGGVSHRPEILYNLSELLWNRNIEYDWLEQNNKCYVIKYKAKIEDFTHYTFDDTYNKKLKIKWVIEKCIKVIHDNIFYGSIISGIYAYMNFNVTVLYSDIVKIYTEEEYIAEFNVNDD